jgi:hypothetical protein
MRALRALWFLPLALLVFHATDAGADGPSCLTGGDGHAACGYACLEGSDGHAACANTPGGLCDAGSDGKVVCTTFVARPNLAPLARPSDTPAGCTVGTNGRAACGWDCKVGSDGVASCSSAPDGVCEAGSDGHVACSSGVPQLWRVRSAAATCAVGSNGKAACGFDCRAGSDGQARCADTPDGACAEGGDGVVRCTSLRRFVNAPPSPAACLEGTDGHVACGYDCKIGHDGRAACATTADGACASGATEVACTRFDPALRPPPEATPEVTCTVGANGHAACGYACAAGSNGRAVCSAVAEGACAAGADGQAVCYGGASR